MWLTTSYRRALVEPLLRCIEEEEAIMVMNEVHSRIYGEHLARKNMALKIIRHGVFWLTMWKDCENYSKQCKPCQMYGSVSHKPSVPLPKSSKKCQYIIVAIEYFTKWTEDKPLSRIQEVEVMHFFMEHIVFRIRVRRIVVTDNGTQFTDKIGKTHFNNSRYSMSKHLLHTHKQTGRSKSLINPSSKDWKMTAWSWKELGRWAPKRFMESPNYSKNSYRWNTV